MGNLIELKNWKNTYFDVKIMLQICLWLFYFNWTSDFIEFSRYGYFPTPAPTTYFSNNQSIPVYMGY